jgi:uncharacterized protein DUF5994
VGEQGRARDPRHGRADPATAPAADPVCILTFPDRQARLVLNRRGVGPGSLDGGWWPRSRDARTQLPDLVTGLSKRYGVVLHLAVNVLAWDEIPHRITMADHVVRVDRYTDVNHVIVVMLGHREQLQLLVVPPLAAERAALTALAMSSHPSNLGAQEILEYCGIEAEQVPRRSARPNASAA